MLRLHNTLTGKIEEFKPIKNGYVGMYNCGPTVYDQVHIGNLRSFVLADTLRRAFEFFGYEVNQVMNITDIGHLSGDGDDGEDKMTKGLKREGKALTIEAMKELADFYAEQFKRDITMLNIKHPHVMPKASEHITEDIGLIKTLEEKGFAYKTTDGVYFDTSKDPQYGKMGGVSNDEENVARVISTREKKNPKDFALWKLNDSIGFQSPWGQGFPGWHIECSAMSRKYLGDHFDVHTGGIDLAPIHHNNEIAQSENACGCKSVNYWVHNAFVNVESGKMAKSEGNFITLKTLIDKKFMPLTYRYWLLQARYSTPVNFSFEALESAQQAYIKLLKLWQTMPDGGSPAQNYIDAFTGLVAEDLDTPRAIALLWEVVKDDEISLADKKTTLLEFDKVLGLNLNKMAAVTTFVNQKIEQLPEEIQVLIARREEARKNKNFSESDTLRNDLKSKGYLVEDKPEGPAISKL